jgi:iron complex outermembrane receptor protein
VEVKPDLSEFITGEVVLDEHPGSHTRVGRQKLTQSAGKLGELLARETGIQLRQSGGFGSFASITIRGASSAQTAVYLDGILLNSGGQPVIDLSTLELLNLHSVDIYRGTSPMQLASGGIGGAVNLNSLKASDQSTTRIRLGTGSLDKQSFQLNHQGRHSDWDWVASTSYQHSENDFVFLNDNTTPLNPEDDRWQRRNNSQVERSAWLLKAGYQPSLDYRTNVMIQAVNRTLGVPEWRNSADNQAAYDTDKIQLQVSQTIDNLSNWNSHHTLYRHIDDAHYTDLLNQVGLAAQDLEFNNQTDGARSYWETFTSIGTLGISMDFRRESLTSVDFFSADDSYKVERDSMLASSHLAWSDSSEQWTLTPAVRWRRLNSGVLENPSSATANSTQTDRTDTSLQLGLAWKPKAGYEFSANVGNYFREPSFGELYGSIGLINGNPDLLPEEGLNVDLGLRYTGKSMALSVTGYLSARDELIVNTFDARGIGRPVNTGKSQVTGIEISGDVDLSRGIKLTSNLTLQNPRNRNPFKGFNNKLLPGEAKRSFFTKLEYTPSLITYWYQWQITRDRFYDSANLLPAADSFVQSVGLDLQYRKWRFSTQIHNIGNENFEDFNGYPKPGRTWSLALTRTL